MNGLNFARAIKAISKAQLILLITASVHSSQQYPERFNEFDAVVAKPFALADLTNAVAGACNSF